MEMWHLFFKQGLPREVSEAAADIACRALRDAAHPPQPHGWGSCTSWNIPPPIWSTTGGCPVVRAIAQETHLAAPCVAGPWCWFERTWRRRVCDACGFAAGRPRASRALGLVPCEKCALVPRSRAISRGSSNAAILPWRVLRVVRSGRWVSMRFVSRADVNVPAPAEQPPLSQRRAARQRRRLAVPHSNIQD